MAGHWGPWEWTVLAMFVGIFAWGALENRHALREMAAEIVSNRRRVLRYAFFIVAWLYLAWRDEVTTLLVTALLTWALWPSIRTRWLQGSPDDAGLMDDEELGRSLRDLLKH
jgi:hypothetical protein